jgi:hypothetical protein
LLTGLATFVDAQSFNTGTLIGTVTDPSGAVVPGTQITLRDSTTGQAHSVTTNNAGQYSFPAVPPGTYSVTATHSGFSEVSAPRVVIDVGKSSTVNLQLEVGTSQQVVTLGARGFPVPQFVRRAARPPFLPWVPRQGDRSARCEAERPRIVTRAAEQDITPADGF